MFPCYLRLSSSQVNAYPTACHALTINEPTFHASVVHALPHRFNDMLNTTNHYIDVIMTTMASQITSLTIVYSTVSSDAGQRKHQSSASLAFVWGNHRDRWIPHTKGQLRGKCFHLMTSSWINPVLTDIVFDWCGRRLTNDQQHHRYVGIVFSTWTKRDDFKLDK